MALLDAYGNEIQTNTGPVFQEIASLARTDVAAAFAGELLSIQNDVLQGLPQSRAELARLLRDDQVHACLQQRRGAILSREWRVEAGGKRKADQMAADWLRETISAVGWDRVVDRMHYGTFFGMAVGELLYVRDGRYVGVEQIKVRDATRFRYGRHFDLRLVTPGRPSGEPLPARKFWTYTAGAIHDDDPYGVGLGHFLYWPVTFKRQGIKFALTFLERFAHPTPVGKYAPGTPLSEQKKLLQALDALTTSLGIIIPEGMSLDKFEGLRTGTGSYDPFLDRMNAAISKVVLSQTMTTDDGSSKSQAEVHAGVAEHVQKADSDLLCGSFNAGMPWCEGPVEWLTQWNFPGAKPPRFYYVFEEPEDLNALSERDQRIFATGFRRTQVSMDETYGEGYEPISPLAPPVPAASEGGSPVPVATEKSLGRTAEFAEGGSTAAPPDVYEEPLASAADLLFAGWVDQARELLSEVEGLAEFGDRLLELFPQLSPVQLAGVMGEATTAARLGGRYDVRYGRAD